MTIDIDTLRERVSGTTLRLPAIDPAEMRTRAPETVDALFHLPLLALVLEPVGVGATRNGLEEIAADGLASAADCGGQSLLRRIDDVREVEQIPDHGSRALCRSPADPNGAVH